MRLRYRHAIITFCARCAQQHSGNVPIAKRRLNGRIPHKHFPFSRTFPPAMDNLKLQEDTFYENLFSSSDVQPDDRTLDEFIFSLYYFKLRDFTLTPLGMICQESHSIPVCIQKFISALLFFKST